MRTVGRQRRSGLGEHLEKALRVARLESRGRGKSSTAARGVRAKTGCRSTVSAIPGLNESDSDKSFAACFFDFPFYLIVRKVENHPKRFTY